MDDELKGLIKKVKKCLNLMRLNLIKKRENLRYKATISKFLKKHSRSNSKFSIVLIWELGGFPFILRKNSIFSHALKVRGHKVCFVICDGVSFACMQRGLEKRERIEDWSKSCINCKRDIIKMAEKCKVDYIFASNFINKEKINEFKCLSRSIELEKIMEFEFLDVKVGELAWSSASRYFKGFLVSVGEMIKDEVVVYREYFYAALINTYIADVIINRYKPDTVLTSHGVYVDYAPPFIIAFKKGIPTLSWSSGFKNYHHYFAAPKNCKKFCLRHLSRDFSAENLSELQKMRLNNFFNNRYFKREARDLSNCLLPESNEILRNKIGFRNSNFIVTLFSHINWDPCFDLSSMIFESANEWVIESIKKMIEIKDVNWIIRNHPGERIDNSLFTTDDLIKREFKNLPEHIRILWSDSDINTYGLFQLIDVGITIFGTVGVELPFFGKPIITAGDAHFSGNGFSIDAKSREEYFEILKNVKDIKPLTDEQIELARRYAYSYFIERQIPLNIINKSQGHWGDIDINRLDELLPGNDPVLDRICDCIVSGTDVILDEDILQKQY